ncbi:MAG: ABC transporter permease [Gemmatimonadales bacterium]
MANFIADLKYAIRALVKNPGFTAVAVLTLALGIGANSAIFSVVNGVILKPLQYDEPGELVMITGQFPNMGFDKFWMSVPEFLELKERNRSFANMGGYRTGEVSITGGDRPMRVNAGFATYEVLEVLGVPAHRGRIFSENEDQPGGDAVFLMSYELWRGRFGGDEDLLGSTLVVNGTPSTLVGIMPPKFDLNDNGIEAWVPFQLDRVNTNPRSNHFLFLVGRLHPTVSLAGAQGELASLFAQWAELNAGQHSPSVANHPLAYESLHEEVVGSVRPALYTLLGAVGFVLLIACANVANLLLAKAESRQKEIAVRSALGAGTGRLLRQFLTEGLVLAIVGGAFGLIFGYWGVKLLLATSPGSVPRISEIGLDLSVVGFTLGVSLLTGLLFGLAPLFHLRGDNMNVALREGGQRTTAGASRQQLRRLLVVSEVALAVILIVGSGLMLRSFAALQDVDAGFKSDGLLTFRLFLPSSDYPAPTDHAAFFDRIVREATAQPGIERVALMSGLPPNRPVNANDMQFEGIQPTANGPPLNVDYWQFVTTDYFETMEIPIVEGRAFNTADAGTDQLVTIVNETMARTFWPGESALGKRVRPPGGVPWLTVIGVAKDVKQGGLGEQTGTETYFHVPQAVALGFPMRTMNVVFRTSAPPATLAGVARAVMGRLDASLPLADLQPMNDVLGGSVAQPRFLTLLLTIFAGVALALAAVGTYGVMSYSVAERSQELGVRIALGAKTPTILRLVLRQGLGVAGLGLAVGILGAIGLTRLLSSLLFEVSTMDVATFALAPVVLAVVAVAACYIPARRATLVDPIEVLKAE